MVSSKSLRHILKFDISKELSTLKEDASASFFCFKLLSRILGSYPLLHGGQALSDTRLPPVPVTLKPFLCYVLGVFSFSRTLFQKKCNIN
jgi:hypothetical protein